MSDQLQDLSETFHRELLDGLHDGVYFTDRRRRIIYWNRAAERITGYAAGDVVGSSCKDNILVHVDELGCCLCHDKCPMMATIEDGEIRHATAYLHHKDGHRVRVLVRTSPILDKHGQVIGAVEIFSEHANVGADSDEIARLHRMAYLDSLTEVANRRYATQMLESRHAEMQRHGWRYGILLGDIDHFKQFNDKYGHDVGDRVLRMVARTMVNAARPYDLISRWGGEEFLIISTHIGRVELLALGERLREMVAGSALTVDSQPLAVRLSLGGSVAQPDDSIEQVLARADECLYESKRAGRNRVTVFQGQHDTHNEQSSPQSEQAIPASSRTPLTLGGRTFGPAA